MPSTHLVVDGSNIATEGRSLPSLRQLDEAVRAFLKERPHDTWTVVVDATFGHRIDSSEKLVYEEALAANEMVTPPAGTIGRGDKFLLEIADRANATVFSNDSFQEFHGDYEWLFDAGRLIGGKPIPEVGWIFTDRTPVRGPKSRMASRAADRRGRASAAPVTRRSRRSSSRPEPLVASRPPPPPRPPAASAAPAAPSPPPRSPVSPGRGKRRSSSPEPVNDPLPFIEFIAEHGPGSSVEGEVLSFTSHGAFVGVGAVRCYLPLKAMGDPPPRSAREVLDRGEVRTFVVNALDAPRRGIDLALPGFQDPEAVAGAGGSGPAAPEPAAPPRPEPKPAPARARRATPRRAAAVTEDGAVASPAGADEVAAVDPGADVPAEAPTAEHVPAAKPASAAKAPSARRASAKKATTEKPATEAPATKKATTRKATTKKAATKKAAAKKAPATKKAPAKKTPAKKAAVKKPATEVPATKKAPTKKAATKKAPATKKAAAEKAATKKAATKKAPTTKRRSAQKASAGKVAAAPSPTPDEAGG